MQLFLQDGKIENYLEESETVDFGKGCLQGYAGTLTKDVTNSTDRIKIIYAFVRDEIRHSFDIGAEKVTCKASEVFEAGHGICYAKSILLVALLRSIGVPAGFCYQGLVFNDVEDKRITLHGLVGVYVKEADKWIRLDARGNKPGVDAQFCLEEEKLAFPVRRELGEFDSGIIYPKPSPNVLNCLTKSKNKLELIKNLPDEI